MNLLPHCNLIVGYKHSIIQDNWRNKVVRVPQKIVDYLTPHSEKVLTKSEVNEIEEYLIENEFVSDDIPDSLILAYEPRFFDTYGLPRSSGHKDKMKK